MSSIFVLIVHELSIVEIDIVDVEDKCNLLDQMGERSEAVESERESLPFVLDQVHDDISLEHRELFRVCQSFHDLAIRFRHRRDNIKLICNLVWLHSLSLGVTHSDVPFI